VVLPKTGLGAAPDKNEMAAYLAIWGLFTLFMFFGTLRLNRALQLVFGAPTVLFFLLSIGDYTQAAQIARLDGYEGILCGLLAVHASMAQVLNEVYGRTLLPLGTSAT
jgi:uncharacterized protein